jgi:hypothetical protein
VAIPLFRCNLPLFALSFLPFHSLCLTHQYPPFIPLCSLPSHILFPLSFPFASCHTMSLFFHCALFTALPYNFPLSFPFGHHIPFPFRSPLVTALPYHFPPFIALLSLPHHIPFPFHSPMFTALANFLPLSFPFAHCLPISFFLPITGLHASLPTLFILLQSLRFPSIPLIFTYLRYPSLKLPLFRDSLVTTFSTVDIYSLSSGVYFCKNSPFK